MKSSAPGHFLHGLDRDIQESLVKGLREEWTHHSTGIEGNSLTLGETAYVLTEGLTIDGKPIKDHNEVLGHGRAVDWAMQFAQGESQVTEEDVFQLHKLVQTEETNDTMKPYGAWKVEPNGTMIRDENERMEYVEFAAPRYVPVLMEKWIQELNTALNRMLSADEAPEVFSSTHTGFVCIHPFWDGNGRMARILANLPLLRSGLPPVVIQRTFTIREQYILLLQGIQKELGIFSKDNAPIPIDAAILDPLTKLVREQWLHSLELVKQAHEQQEKRSS